MIPIEKGKPMPRKPRLSVALPFDDLKESGDSFFVHHSEMINGTVKMAAHRYMKRYGRKVHVFKEPGGSRVFLA